MQTIIIVNEKNKILKNISNCFDHSQNNLNTLPVTAYRHCHESKLMLLIFELMQMI